MYCANCGKENKENAKFCIACGNSLIHNELEDCIAAKTNSVQLGMQKKIRNKYLIYIAIVVFVFGLICSFVRVITWEDTSQIEIKEPTAPLNVKSEEICFYGNELTEAYSIIKEYDEMGNLLLEIKEDENGTQVEKKEYLYENGLLAGANIYNQNGIYLEVEYELDEKGAINVERAFLFSSEIGLIRFPEYTVFYNYDENDILVKKEIEYTDFAARWEYLPEEGVEKYSEKYKNRDYEPWQPKYYRKYDALGNLLHYTEYDEAGNVLIAEEYSNKVTYDSNNRQVYCETYSGDSLVYTKKITYHVLDESSTNVMNENVMVNQYGNAFSNLGPQCSGLSFLPEHFGRVAGQGDKTYFYELHNIYCVDSKGEKTVVCQTNEISCLNIIGDTLFYLEGSKIWSVKTDGSEQTELLTNVCGPFFVNQNSIIYVTHSNITATRSEYFICKYLIDGNEPQQSICTGEIEPTVIGMGHNDTVIYYYQIEPYEEATGWSYKNYYIRHALIESDFTGNIINYHECVAPLPNADTFFWAFCSKDYLYVTYTCGIPLGEDETEICMINSNFENNIVYSMDSILPRPRNCYGNDMIISYGTDLYLYGLQEDGNLGIKNLIVQENSGLDEVYVVDDYVYYTVDSSYANANLYRIKIDGTCWEDI